MLSTNKKKNSKAERKSFLTIFKSHLEGDCDDRKKLKNDKELKVKTVLNEV